MRKKTGWLLFFAVSVLQAYIWINRSDFQFEDRRGQSELYAQCNKNNCERWQRFARHYPMEETIAARQILQAAAISDTGSVMNRALAIGALLQRQFGRFLSQESPALSNRSPWQQYLLLQSDTSLRLMCGNYAQLFNFFCAANGITCRMIELYVPGNHHVLNECYIPELRRWVAVDVTMNRLLFLDEKGIALHFPGLREKIINRSTIYNLRVQIDSLKKEVLRPDAYEAIAYYRQDVPMHYLWQLETPAIYGTGKKIRRYLLPENWYLVYGAPRFPLLYLIKTVVLLAWIFLLVKLLVTRGKD